jgi:hypothetical protein
MSNKFSSTEEAISQLKKWEAAKSPIKALFTGEGIVMSSSGRVLLRFDRANNAFVNLVDESQPPKPILSFPLFGDRFERAEPLLDKGAEGLSWDFLLCLEFPVPCGKVGLYEVAE